VWYQATLAPGEANGRSILLCKVGNGKPIMLCSLRDGLLQCMNLHLILDQCTEFTVQGPAAIHVAGYYLDDDAGLS
jgi:hypothetical protein